MFAAGHDHSVIVVNGQILQWGTTFLGDGSSKQLIDNPTANGLTRMRVASMCAGWNFTVVVNTNSEIFVWGANLNSQITSGTSDQPKSLRLDPLLFEKESISKVVCGFSSVAFLSNTSSVWMSGDLSPVRKDTPVKLDQFSKIVDVAIGANYVILLTSAGYVISWGTDTTYSCELGRMGSRSRPGYVVVRTNVSVVRRAVHPVHPLSDSLKVVAIATGAHHTIVLTSEGKLFGWGRNTYGRLCQSFVQMSIPASIRDGSLAGETVIKIEANRYVSLFLSSKGQLHGCGHNRYLGRVSGPESQSIPVAINVEALKGRTVREMSTMSLHTLVLYE